MNGGGSARPNGSLGLRVIRKHPSLRSRIHDFLWRLFR